MISNKRQKKVLISIIAVITFLVVSFVATKIIYDKIFARYDCKKSINFSELQEVIDSRQTFKYNSEENLLSGYLYESLDGGNSTLIVLAPGFGACSNDYLWQIKELTELGWSVFAFDPTGCCSSEGDSAVGFSQEVLDLEATLDFIEDKKRFDFENIALLGHSRGGYAVCCALAEDYDISAVVSISGINSAMDGIIGASTRYVGDLAYANYGFLWLYQTMLFGQDVVDMRVDEVLNTTESPVLIVHGADDSSVPADKFSIISHKSEITNDKVEYYLCSSPNNSGHTDLLFEKDGSADNRLIKEINDFLYRHIEEKGVK